MPITPEQARNELRRREALRELERRGKLTAPPTTIAPKLLRMPQVGQTLIEPPMLAPEDPEYPLERYIEDIKPGPIARMFGRGAELAEKGLWKGLGAVGTVYDRAERAVATPLTRPIEKRVRFMPPVEPGRELSFGAKAKRMLGGAPSLESVKAEWKETWPATKAGLKALVPWRGMAPPEETRTFRDLIGPLKTIESGREPSELYKTVYGTALSFAVTPKVLAGGLKAIGGAAKLTGIPQKVKVARIPEWQIGRLKTRAELGARTEKAIELAKPLGRKPAKQLAKELTRQTGIKVTPRAAKLRMGQLIKGGITTRPELTARVNPVIQEFEQNMATLQKLGLLGKETYITKLPRKRIAELFKEKTTLQQQIRKLKAWPAKTVGAVSAKTGKLLQRRYPGQAKKITALQEKIDGITDKIQTSYKLGGTKYMPRMYRTKEEERLARRFMGWSKHRIRVHYAKKRQAIPFEVRKMMGEIKEPSYPIMKRLIQEGADIETSKLFSFAASKPEWVSNVWRQGLATKAIPTGKAYGALAGKFVSPRIYSDVTELMRIRGNFEKAYDTLIGSWKLGKVVLNPATHFRNKISNKILLDLSGMGYAEQAKYAGRVFKEYRANSIEYQTAKRYFARTTLIKGEILDDILRTTRQAKGAGIERGINAIRSGTKWLTKKPSQMYQHEEFVNKFMKYLQQRDRGKSVIDSVLEANKWLFDYGDLTKWEVNIARRVMPFYTFPRKALPRVLEAAATRPYTLAKYPLLAKMTTQYSLAKLNLTNKDYEEIQKVLPDYMKQGSYILMPYRDENNDLRFFDWTYIIPWGTLAEIQERGPLDIFYTNPLVQLVGDVKRNKSSWTDKEIWKETDTQEEKTFKSLQHIWTSLTPSLAPKGLYWDKLAEAATGKPSRIGKVRPIPETVAHTVFGLRTQAIDVREQQKWRLIEKSKKLKEFRSKLFNITQRKMTGNISVEEYDKLKEQYKKQIKKLLKK